jgi:hypothetical protein
MPSPAIPFVETHPNTYPPKAADLKKQVRATGAKMKINLLSIVCAHAKSRGPKKPGPRYRGRGDNLTAIDR